MRSSADDRRLEPAFGQVGDVGEEIPTHFHAHARDKDWWSRRFHM